MMAGIGALSGFYGVINALMAASFAGVLYYGVLMLFKKQAKDGIIPFGPFLSFGLLVNLFYPGKFFLLLI